MTTSITAVVEATQEPNYATSANERASEAWQTLTELQKRELQKWRLGGQLPDVEGTAELIITQHVSTPTSMFDLFGQAPRLRSAADIAAQIQAERNEWGEP